MSKFFCYCDASYNALEEVSQIGILIQDEFGQTIYNKTKRPNKLVTNVAHAELLAISESLLVIRDSKMKRVLIHSDNQGVVEKINKREKFNKGGSVLNPLVESIHQRLTHFESELVWVSRDENEEADKLSKGVKDLSNSGLSKQKYKGKIVSKFKGKKIKTPFEDLKLEQIIALQSILKKSNHEKIQIRLKEFVEVEESQQEVTETTEDTEKLSVVV
ncbi:ribonuclease H-like domain-containing protein [Bacillus cereus]|nr:ribonuclease H-like domain-containing protein [Bacillus cereus]